MVRSVRSREAGPLDDRDVVAVGASKFLSAGIDHDLGFSHMAVAPTKGERRPNMTTSAMSDYDDIHANSLLASTFSHPREVLANPVLDVLQKRCILATWASDAFAVEGKPWLRQIPGSDRQVRIGDVLAALRTLDGPPPRRGGAIHFTRKRKVGQTAYERKRQMIAVHP
jgi:hypothetical protein